MFRYFENLVDPFCDYPEQDQPPQKLLPFMLAHCRPFYRVFALTGFFAIMAASFELTLIWAMGWIVDVMQTSTPDQVISNHGHILLALVVFVLVIRPIIYTLNFMFLLNGLTPNIATLFRWRSHKQVMRQSIGWFENDFAGRIANRVMQTPGSAGEVVFQIFDAFAYILGYVVGAFLILQGADPQLLVPLLLWFVGFVLLARWTTNRVEPASKASSDARSELNGRIVDAYTNIHSVKLFANQRDELEFARTAIADTRNTVIREMRIFTMMDVVLMFLNGFLIVGVVGWAIWLWLHGQTSAGTVAAATALVLRLNAMTGWIMWATTTFFRELGVVSEGMETLAQPITLLDGPDAKPLSVTQSRIEFRDLRHHYGRDQGGVDGFNLTIEPGQKVGLVGRSGAGKSTVLKLLLRFYDAEGGQILIDGQNIAGVTQDSLRRQIGMVQQDNSLLHRSIRENIGYGRADATDAEITNAAIRAHAMEFIETLEDKDGNLGFAARVGERGVKLSGGQRQRIALARVILKDAPILLLDEATSALDSEVEAAILDTLYDMMQGKTVIAIAHRLSTIAHMDRIVVMDQGRVIEDGTHDALLALGGVYAQLWSRQSGGFIDTDT